MASMSDAARDTFLRETRVAVLITTSVDGPPPAVPVWFEWDGTRARFFTGVESPKMSRIARDPRISLLIANRAGQAEAWVQIDGTAEIIEDGAFELSERLARRYWDMETEAHKTTVDGWRAAADTLRILEITPTRIRSSG